MIKAKGCTLSADGTDIGGFREFDFSGGSVGQDDVTTQADTHARKDPMIPDAGDFSVGVIYDPLDAGQAKLRDSFENGTKLAMVLTYPSGDTETFTAFATSYPIPGQLGSTVKQTVGMAIDGGVTFTDVP